MVAPVAEVEKMTDEVAIRLGRGLREARARAGITAAELARRLSAAGLSDTSIPPNYVSRWEAGGRRLDVETITMAEQVMKLRAGTVFRLAGYVDDGDLIDVGTLPPWSQRSVRAILKDAGHEELVSGNGEDGA